MGTISVEMIVRQTERSAFRLGIGRRVVRKVGFSGNEPFNSWPGCQGNYLAVLTFAWSYILSATLIEILGPYDSEWSATHILFQTQHQLHDKEDIVIQIGDTSNSAAQWWAEILGNGWSASICRNRTTYHSPWPCEIDSTQKLKAETKSSITLSSTDETPPSSTSALQFLQDFCSIHQIHEQVFPVLAAALLLPSFQQPLSLPLPNPTTVPLPRYPTDTPHIDETARLHYYMTLSCHGMLRLLWSVYYKPRIFFNDVQLWWKAASDVFNGINDDEILAKVMSKRQPRTAALWLGIIIIGKEKLSDERPFVDIVAAAWTDLDLSFITLPCSDNDMGNMISREDECRLLVITTDRSLPTSPWPPCGAVSTEGLEPDLRKYAKYSGVHLQYRGWEWRPGIGSTMGPGVMRAAPSTESSAPSSDPANRSSQASSDHDSDKMDRNATQAILDWVRPDGFNKYDCGINLVRILGCNSVQRKRKSSY